MKKVIYILSVIFLFSCDSEDAGDCFQKAGELTRKEITVNDFDKILVNRDIELIIKQDITQSVVIESGINIINDVEAQVIDGRLELTNNNTCNFVREYGLTKVFITSPNLTEIRTSTQFDISSDGILSYNELSLLSEDFNEPDTFTVSDFKMELNITKLNVVTNNISSFYLKGHVDDLNVSFADGTGRFEGRDLIAQDVTIFHRGSNDIIVNPQESLTGTLIGTGNLISVNEPPIVDVEVNYTGQLTFE